MTNETKESVIISPLTKEEMIALLKSDVKEWNKYVLRADLRNADLHGADLRNADLSGADLSYADLSCAKLSGADLSSATGNLEEIRSIHCFERVITYSSDRMWIGCQSHTIEEWWQFTDDQINSMSTVALGRWTKWKPLLQQIIAAYPATPITVTEKTAQP